MNTDLNGCYESNKKRQIHNICHSLDPNIQQTQSSNLYIIYFSSSISDPNRYDKGAEENCR
ncbi:hypothetical protein NMG60_11014945 [Bertholletia excelsa]